jgi:mono/diheme cytochrome c family protein
MSNLTVLATAAALRLTASVASAQSAAGLEEVLHSRASCHGIAGQGNGPLAEYMNGTVPDLTRIGSENDGEFPMLQVMQIIEGHTGVRGHGSEMPVWGSRYQAEMAADAGDYGAKLLVAGRILALATHLQSIQE